MQAAREALAAERASAAGAAEAAAAAAAADLETARAEAEVMREALQVRGPPAGTLLSSNAARR